MKKWFLPFLPFLLYAQQAAAPQRTPEKTTPQRPAEKQMPAATAAASMSRSTMIIDAKARAEDILSAYDQLKHEKPTYHISARTYSGHILSNILDIAAMPNGTWLLIHISTIQGVKTQLISVDDIMDLFYS